MINKADSSDLTCPLCNAPFSNEGGCLTCTRCDIIWFAANPLSSHAKQISASSPNRQTVDPLPDTIRCPQCDTFITISQYAYDSGIRVYKCDSCAGVLMNRTAANGIADYIEGDSVHNRLGEAMIERFRKDGRLLAIDTMFYSRALSAVAAFFVCFIAYTGTGSFETVFRAIAGLSLPLLCIWYPKAMGQLTGIAGGLGRPQITQMTPALAVAIGGWILLLVIVLAMSYVRILAR